MSAQLASVGTPPPPPPSTASPPSTTASAKRQPLRRIAALLWCGFVGAVLCQSLPGAVVVLGWSLRFSRRVAVRRLWRGSAEPGARFEPWLAEEASRSGVGDDLDSIPGWVLAPGGIPRLRREAAAAPTRRAALRRLAAGAIGGLGRNLAQGGLALLTAAIFTLPAGLLWSFAWYSGWDNSFNKGYEQAAVGPLLGLLGVLLFVLAMLHLPLVQARQALTGSWRRSFDLRLLRCIGAARPLGLALLAGLFALASLPVNVLKTAPAFLTTTRPEVLEMSDRELLELLNGHFFWVGVVSFPLFVMLRMAAARLYAGGLVAAVERGAVDPDGLAPGVERRLALRLRTDRRPPSWRRLRRGGRSTLRLGATAASVLLWLALVAQVFVSEFFAYHGPRGWLNQPLVQLPWVRYVPEELAAAARTGGRREAATAAASASAIWPRAQRLRTGMSQLP